MTRTAEPFTVRVRSVDVQLHEWRKKKKGSTYTIFDVRFSGGDLGRLYTITGQVWHAATPGTLPRITSHPGRTDALAALLGRTEALAPLLDRRPR